MGTGPLSDEEAELASLALEDESAEAKRVFQEAAPDSARAIVRISHFGSNERVKLEASKYVLDRVLGKISDKPVAPEDNPYKSMMAELVGELKEASALHGVAEEYIHQEAIRPETDAKHEGRIRDIYKELEGED